MLITTAWYTRPEQPSRIATWYCSNGLGVAGGGLLGYAIGNIKGDLPSWRYEFLIVGALCASWGIVLWFLLPDSPPTARWLGREERLMAVARLRKNQTGVDTKVFKWDQASELHICCADTRLKGGHRSLKRSYTNPRRCLISERNDHMIQADCMCSGSSFSWGLW